MSKPFELIYSAQSAGFVDGLAYANPRYFSTPRAGVSKVFVVGDWPLVVAAYEDAGVPVEQLDIAPVGPGKGVTAPVVHTSDDPFTVTIPDDWESLNWQKLRSLASSVSSEPIKNSDEAKAAINAELKRRWLDAPNEDAGGLTHRELNADLTELGIEIDPADTAAQKLAKRDEAREARA